MDARGTRLFGEVLHGPEDATFVRRREGEVLVSDGPFAESKEWIAGFDVLEVRDLAEAIEVASKHPMARGGTLELRPLWPFDVHDDHVARHEREAAERGIRVEPSGRRSARRSWGRAAESRADDGRRAGADGPSRRARRGRVGPPLRVRDRLVEGRCDAHPHDG